MPKTMNFLAAAAFTLGTSASVLALAPQAFAQTTTSQPGMTSQTPSLNNGRGHASPNNGTGGGSSNGGSNSGSAGAGATGGGAAGGGAAGGAAGGGATGSGGSSSGNGGH